ncbi:methyltransferase domain-containing protein [Oceanicaulis alexandrii]|uniref:methyltransferase domain-containing protein n=1 Tax=Oceanicaulis alexandrii TaxID=153233 RepID=UPI00235252F4|nr:methyltransferase domain-containing protein [Oceanicaulis alexandrii]
MRPEEAEYLGALLERCSRNDLSPLLNIGASTRAFREVSQPHIQECIFTPLDRRGVEVIHSDIKQADGVDLTGDILDPGFREHIRALRPRAILCSNVLEHVTDIAAFTSALEECLEPGGLMIVSGPQSYPFHADPIDNYFRPSPQEMADRFKQCEPEELHTITSSSYWVELAAMPVGVRLCFLAKSALRLPLFFYKPQAYRNRFSRFLWLWRPYKVSVAKLRRR